MMKAQFQCVLECLFVMLHRLHKNYDRNLQGLDHKLSKFSEQYRLAWLVWLIRLIQWQMALPNQKKKMVS